MADEPEVIRQQMEETRSHLAQKLEALEDQVAGTVRSTTETVGETVEAVKETVENVTEAVQETVHSVGEVFDIRLQAQRHPWMVFAGSMAAGALAAQLIPRTTSWSSEAIREPSEPEPSRPAGSSRVENGRYWTAAAAEVPAAEKEQRGEGVLGWLSEHLSHLKGLAVGTLMGVVRDAVAQALPETLKDKVAEEIDHFTTALGGEPIRGPIFHNQEEKTSEASQGSESQSSSPRREAVAR